MARRWLHVVALLALVPGALGAPALASAASRPPARGEAPRPHALDSRRAPDGARVAPEDNEGKDKDDKDKGGSGGGLGIDLGSLLERTSGGSPHDNRGGSGDRGRGDDAHGNGASIGSSTSGQTAAPAPANPVQPPAPSMAPTLPSFASPAVPVSAAPVPASDGKQGGQGRGSDVQKAATGGGPTLAPPAAPPPAESKPLDARAPSAAVPPASPVAVAPAYVPPPSATALTQPASLDGAPAGVTPPVTRRAAARSGLGAPPFAESAAADVVSGGGGSSLTRFSEMTEGNAPATVPPGIDVLTPSGLSLTRRISLSLLPQTILPTRLSQGAPAGALDLVGGGHSEPAYPGRSEAWGATAFASRFLGRPSAVLASPEPRPALEEREPSGSGFAGLSRWLVTR